MYFILRVWTLQVKSLKTIHIRRGDTDGVSSMCCEEGEITKRYKETSSGKGSAYDPLVVIWATVPLNQTDELLKDLYMIF